VFLANILATPSVGASCLRHTLSLDDDQSKSSKEVKFGFIYGKSFSDFSKVWAFTSYNYEKISQKCQSD
jgi:hypothetical protein